MAVFVKYGTFVIAYAILSDMKSKLYQGYLRRQGGHGPTHRLRMIRCAGNPLRHYVFHTEADMTWGDMSAESADLALSLLWNHFQGRGSYGSMYTIDLDGFLATVNKKSEPAFRLHKAFLREVVAHWKNNEPWVYTTEELEAWLVLQR